MTDNHDEPDIQNSGISNEPETAIQNAVPTEDKTLLHSDALTNEAVDEPTRKFAAPAGELQTNHKTKFENEPTKVLQDESQNDEADEPPAVPDENALRPSHLRFALVCLFFVFATGANIINLAQIFGVTSSRPEWVTEWKEKRFIITAVDPNFADRIKLGDEVIAVNNEFLNYSNHVMVVSRIKADERYTLQIKRETESLDVGLIQSSERSGSIIKFKASSI